MADRFYSVILGDQAVSEVTEGSSTSSEAVELRVSDSIYASKLEVLKGLDAIKRHLQTVETSPIA
jgi:hypothetical protein